ncbi:triacylglycerol lipase [Enterococcus faecalis 02-MB-P-10]|uniref:lipase family protein n=1 Tax=Enterococcus faecalis TaxID=1351 RepID=UPI0003530140|nr:triacylglycerol lipase [Enterococcus faecalis]EPH68899.1 triacylglycerol lipase [Enterococcus faecalis 02-MB-P-10]
MDQYRKFSDKVYGVETEKIKTGDVFKNKKEKYLVLDTIDTNKDTLKIDDAPRKNSMQAMTVAEIKDEYKSTKRLETVPGYPESVIKKDLTIAYAGTKTKRDWETNVSEIFLEEKNPEGAFYTSMEYAREIEEKYSKQEGFTINTTGHSLGGAEAIFVAVLLHYNAITYGAAGSGLSKEQLEAYNGQIVNFYDTSDVVTTGSLTGGQEKIPFYSFGIDNAGWKTFGHDLEQFKIDSAGNYIDKFGDVVVYTDGHGGVALEQTLLAQEILENKKRLRDLDGFLFPSGETLAEIKQLKQENQWLQEQIKQFNRLNELRYILTASGGGLSTNERIYLEDSQALAVVKTTSSRFDVALEESITIYKHAVQQLTQDWEAGKKLIRQHAPDLSNAEIMEAMESMGYTQQAVNEAIDYFQEKIRKAMQIKTRFTQLTQQITTKINELVQRDQELASQLKGALG